MSSPCVAHDLWLDLEQDPDSRKSIVIQAVLSAKFPKVDEVKKVEDYREPRMMVSGPPVQPLPDFGLEPTLVGRVTTDQPFAVSVLGPTREIDLKLDEAREYLAEEVGLPPGRIAAILDGDAPTVHETYSRILKGIGLRDYGKAPGGLDFGLPIEIRLVRVNLVPPDGWDIKFEILKDGKPLPDAYARILAPARKTQGVRTDKLGSATVSLPRRGSVLIAYIELVSASKGRYETRWTNLAIFAH